jgi:hypothetical protein
VALSLALILLVVSGFVGVVSSAPPDRQKGHNGQLDGRVLGDALDMIRRGRTTFRDDTFGSEDFWGGELRLHEAIAKVPPTTALGVGLKVDLDALPRSLVSDLKRGRVDLGDPAVTQALLRLNAVVGVKGFFDSSSKLNSIGIQCALCHSTVDDALAPGIGRRLDGWANRDLNIGAIVALAPDLSPFADLLGVSEDTVRRVLNAWGPGKFDAALSLDGKGFRPDGKTAATLIPPAFGLAGINLHTFTGWGSVTHWNAFVAVLEMHGKGTFYDPRLKDATRFPVAAAAGFDNVRNEEDRVTSKLAALHFYQLALRAPRAPSKLFDRAAAQRGQGLFTGKGKCSTCHVPPLYSEPGYNLHTPAEINIDPFQANRSPDGGYRTTPLKGLWTHMKGGFYHDGRFATLQDVIAHYDSFFGLGLGAGEKADLEEFLKSL